MVKTPYLHPIFALAKANHDLPRVTWYPPRASLGYKTRKTEEYPYESIMVIISYKILSGLIIEPSSILRITLASFRLILSNYCIIMVILILMIAPKSTSALSTLCPLNWLLIIELPISSYLY